MPQRVPPAGKPAPQPLRLPIPQVGGDREVLHLVPIGEQLLLPDRHMPEVVARTHLVETLWSNLIFGAIVGGLLSSKRAKILYPDAGMEPMATHPSEAPKELPLNSMPSVH